MKSARLQCQRWLKIINNPLNYTFNGYTNNAPTIFHLFIPSIGFFKMKHLLYQQRKIVFCKFLPQYLAGVDYLARLIPSTFYNQPVCSRPGSGVRGTIFKYMQLLTLRYFHITGLDTDVIKFLIFTLTLLLTSLCACGVAFFVSACVRTFAIANLLIALPYVFMMVCHVISCV